MEYRIKRWHQFCVAIVNVLENCLGLEVVQSGLGVVAVGKVLGNWVDG